MRCKFFSNLKVRDNLITNTIWWVTFVCVCLRHQPTFNNHQQHNPAVIINHIMQYNSIYTHATDLFPGGSQLNDGINASVSMPQISDYTGSCSILTSVATGATLRITKLPYRVTQPSVCTISSAVYTKLSSCSSA